MCKRETLTMVSSTPIIFIFFFFFCFVRCVYSEHFNFNFIFFPQSYDNFDFSHKEETEESMLGDEIGFYTKE